MNKFSSSLLFLLYHNIMIFDALLAWVAEPFSKWGSTSACQDNYRKILLFELATVTSQT